MQIMNEPVNGSLGIWLLGLVIAVIGVFLRGGKKLISNGALVMGLGLIWAPFFLADAGVGYSFIARISSFIVFGLLAWVTPKEKPWTMLFYVLVAVFFGGLIFAS